MKSEFLDSNAPSWRSNGARKYRKDNTANGRVVLACEDRVGPRACRQRLAHERSRESGWEIPRPRRHAEIPRLQIDSEIRGRVLCTGSLSEPARWPENAPDRRSRTGRWDVFRRT